MVKFWVNEGVKVLGEVVFWAKFVLLAQLLRLLSGSFKAKFLEINIRNYNINKEYF